VFGVAKQSGGGVRIDSTPGAGASVRVFLPRAAAAAPSERVAPAVEVVAPPARDFNVLLVDDDSAVREVTAGILHDLGYRVVEAGSGGAALDLLDRQSKIDLLLVDFAMPGMNGAEVAREVHARRPGLPVLFVTGYADTEALDTAGGGDGILRKPFLEEDLAARLRAALGTS
jgi:CheY-like chemotaxis protein